jgi:NADH-quinone oxidoreductase subunit N
LIKIEIFTLAWSPVYALLIGLIIILALDLFFRESAKDYIVFIATLTLVAAAGLVFDAKGSSDIGDLFKFGDFFMVFSLIGLLSSIIVVFTAWKDMTMELDLGVFFSLLLLANVGGIIIAASNNFIPLYLGFELVSIPTYAMVAFRKKDRAAAEAALKIFLLGALSSAFIIYGLAMYYGATGTLAFNAAVKEGSKTLQFAAVTLIAAGSGFKIGVVPFHFWIPDVYSGAPISVVNFLSASSKKMAFAFVIQLFFVGMAGANFTEYWGVIFVVLATLSVVLGNAAAVIQTRIMRLLAYSTIAQAGYIVIGFAAYAAAEGSNLGLQEAAMKGILLHIVAHVLMKGAAFAAVLLVVDSYGDDRIDNFTGLFHKSPLVASALAIAMFSLMGIPPLGGFFGKFFLFLSAVDADLTWLAIVGIVGSAVSIYYYAKVIRTMAEQPKDDVEIKSHPGIVVMLVILTLLTIGFGLFTNAIIDSAVDIVKNYFP